MDIQQAIRRQLKGLHSKLESAYARYMAARDLSDPDQPEEGELKSAILEYQNVLEQGVTRLQKLCRSQEVLCPLKFPEVQSYEIPAIHYFDLETFRWVYVANHPRAFPSVRSFVNQFIAAADCDSLPAEVPNDARPWYTKSKSLLSPVREHAYSCLIDDDYALESIQKILVDPESEDPVRALNHALVFVCAYIRCGNLVLSGSVDNWLRSLAILWNHFRIPLPGHTERKAVEKGHIPPSGALQAELDVSRALSSHEDDSVKHTTAESKTLTPEKESQYPSSNDGMELHHVDSSAEATHGSGELPSSSSRRYLKLCDAARKYVREVEFEILEKAAKSRIVRAIEKGKVLAHTEGHNRLVEEHSLDSLILEARNKDLEESTYAY